MLMEIRVVLHHWVKGVMRQSALLVLFSIKTLQVMVQVVVFLIVVKEPPHTTIHHRVVPE